MFSVMFLCSPCDWPFGSCVNAFIIKNWTELLCTFCHLMFLKFETVIHSLNSHPPHEAWLYFESPFPDLIILDISLRDSICIPTGNRLSNMPVLIKENRLFYVFIVYIFEKTFFTIEYFTFWKQNTFLWTAEAVTRWQVRRYVNSSLSVFDSSSSFNVKIFKTKTHPNYI